MFKNGFLFLLLLIPAISFCQLFPPAGYPQNYFGNPLNIPISLAANFGELRSNHYHMGLDIRTAHRENLPVFAAADGYIYRIKIEPFGFGQAVYIKHTNGYISLYAHLNSFNAALSAFILKKQYELERWDISLELPPNGFPVKKGDLIAYSGNTGGSQGPHLHFEIRTGETNLNPLLFGLPVPDNVPPVCKALSVYDRNRSFYEQWPLIVPVKGSKGKYNLDRPLLIVTTSSPGFGISTSDAQTGSSNPNGTFQAVIFDNGIPVSGFQMDRISYDETKGINAHIDYPTHERGGRYYQLLFRMPGYRPSIYREAVEGGYINLSDNKIHEIRIELLDASGNKSSLEFNTRYQPEIRPGNFFQGKMFYPGMLDGFEALNAAFYIGASGLYDSLHIPYQEIQAVEKDLVSSEHRIGDKNIPLADSMTVRIRINKTTVPRNLVIMQKMIGEEYEVKRPEWAGEWATSTFKSFGLFRLMVDSVPPDIRIPGIAENADLSRSSRIAVVVSDNFKKIKNFRGRLDGKWLLFSNDKSRAFIYHFDEHCGNGNHELVISVEDEAGNGSQKILHFRR